MTLVNVRAAFEKAITDSVIAADNTVLMIYDNVNYTTPGKTKKFITTSITFSNQQYKIKVQRQIIILVLFNVTFMFQKDEVHLFYLL
tara:strand:+ start:575 stop:835 length:261 start_codon:yes stop_codon:yes gene_type:complete